MNENKIKRNEERIFKSVLVYRDNGSFDLLGVSTNISKNGLFVESPYILSRDSEVSLAIGIANELFKIKGEVRWNKNPGDKYPTHIPAGMGIRITEAPVEYLNYVEYVRHQNGNVPQYH